MGQLNVYNFLSANGCFKGPGEDISWARQSTTQEETEFASENAQAGGALLFGRKTYEMMAAYWPTEQAKKNTPGISEGMTKAEKFVFSKTLKKTNWDNTHILTGNIEDEVKKLKQRLDHITILGSGSIVNQLAEKGLIDQFQLMIHPVAVGNGAQFLSNIDRAVSLELVSTRSFKSGIVLLTYRTK